MPKPRPGDFFKSYEATRKGPELPGLRLPVIFPDCSQNGTFPPFAVVLGYISPPDRNPAPYQIAHVNNLRGTHPIRRAIFARFERVTKSDTARSLFPG